jgi:predicted nucleic acid-binding protein
MKLVDTSAWVEFLRRKGDPRVKHAVANLIQREGAAYTCPIRFELLSGVRGGEEADLERALGLSHHLPFGPEDWAEAARMERRLRAGGLTIPRNDLFVAAAALRAGVAVLCRDEHFAAMARVIGDKLKIEQA